jgi:hypothetical protein
MKEHNFVDAPMPDGILVERYQRCTSCGLVRTLCNCGCNRWFYDLEVREGVSCYLMGEAGMNCDEFKMRKVLK